MNGDNSTAAAAYLSSLSAAAQAAEDAFFAAAAIAQAADQPRLRLLLAAVDHAKAAYESALKGSLISNSAFVQAQQQALDNQVKAVNGQLATLKDVDAWLKFVSDLASLAGSLATAFG